MSRLTPERLASARAISAAAILANQIDLHLYPHRHLAVVAHAGFLGDNVAQLLAAVEHLTHFGWELVNVAELGGSRVLHAFMRRG